MLDIARHYFHDHSVGICSSRQKYEGFMTDNCFQRNYQEVNRTVFGSLTQEDQPGLNARTCLDKETNKTIRKQERSQVYIRCHSFLMDKKTW